MVKPDMVVALGATAARSLFGKAVTIKSMRGRAQTLPDGATCHVTIHPSYLLRIEDQEMAAREYVQFVADLTAAKAALAR